MSRQSRRTFIKSAAAATAAGSLFTIAGTKASGKVLGANDRIRVAVAGVNGRGNSHIDGFCGLEGVEVSYIVDPDTRVHDAAVNRVKDKAGNTPKAIQDIRQALEDANVDCISIATPNHWHSLMTIWGCQAGKDVYVEKPMSHNVHEGRVAVEAARKHDRIVQHGTQRRSEDKWAGAIDFIHSGKAGKLLVSRALCYKPRRSIGFQTPETAPSELDFNLWLGPAKDQPFHRNLVHYNWHWFWDTGNGDIGNQGVHQFDVARWGIKGATLPKSVTSLGGRFGYKDQGETPNTQVSVMDFGDTLMVFEVRGLDTDEYMHAKVGNIFHCEEGTLVEGVFYPKGSDKAEKLPSITRGPVAATTVKRQEPHFANFIAAVRSRNKEDLNADILEGHYSSALCHLANVSYQLGEPVPFDKQAKALGDNKELVATFERMSEHLKDNRVELSGLDYKLGRTLTVDAKNETFVGDEQASTLLTREYRKPFVVPEKIA